MRLNQPSLAIFLAALVLGTLAIISKLGFIPIPRYLPFQEFWLAMTAYLVLAVGNMVRGL